MGLFDKLFGKKKEEKKDDKKGSKEYSQQVAKQAQTKQEMPKDAQKGPSEDDWIYELVLQYLVSPVWKCTISEFLDEHCIVFDDEEENKFSYYDIHKKFKKMMEQLVDGLMAEIGIEEEQFGAVVERGLKSTKHRKYFEQLLIIDNFLVFKKLMIKRNKENELEALRELQKQEQQLKGDNVKVPTDAAIKRLELEKEKAELEHAMALSQAVEEERRKLLQEEEEQLQQVLLLSEMEFKRQQELALSQVSKQQQPAQKAKNETPTPQQQNQVVDNPKEEEQVVVFDEVAQTEVKPSLQSIYGNQPNNQFVDVNAQRAQEQQVQIQKKPANFAKLPSLGQPKGSDVLLGFDQDTSQKQEDRTVIQAQIEKIKQQQVEISNQQEEQESTEERKKRLLQQRELLRQKKQQERQKELENYQKEQEQQQQMILQEQQKQQQNSEFIEQQKKANSDLQRRKELLEQKKKQLLMNKIKEDVNYEADLL